MESEIRTFNPVTELVDFADEFSENYKILSSGTYRSKNDNYTIDYLDIIKDKVTGNIVNTMARIGHTSKVIELGKTKLLHDSITPDFVFYLILWLICKVNSSDYNSDFKTDESVVKYYLTTNRSNKNLALGIIELFSHHMSSGTVDRYNRINKLLTDSQNKESVK